MSVVLACLLAGVVSVGPESETKTVEAALARVAAERQAGRLAAGETAVISLAPGVCELGATLTIPAAAAPVRLVGAPDDGTVLSGGRRLGPFTVGPDGLWRCAVPEGLVFEQLWINGRRAQVAKSPNKFYHYILQNGNEGVDPVTGKLADLSQRQIFTDDAALKVLAATPADELKDVVINVLWAWDSDLRRVAAYDVKTRSFILLNKTGRAFYSWKEWCPRFMIENTRAALDAPGEWFLDRKRSELLYLPLPGERPETTVATVPALKTILRVEGVRGVTFEGITFAYSGWSMGDGFFSHQSGFSAAAALIVRNASEIHFRNCRIRHTGDYGLWFDEGTHDASVRHTLLKDLGAGGVRVGAGDWREKDPAERLVSGITVDDCIIADGGHVLPAGTGVFLTFVKDSRVTHNEICDLYYSGICCGWTWGYRPTPNRNNELSWNHIHHLGKGVMSDMGFVYTLGDSRGTVVAGNHGHDMFSYGYTGSGGTGLYPDEGSRGILWTSNLIHHTKTSALSQHYGRENLFLNNIFAFNSKPGSPIAGRWRAEKHLSLACTNNIFVWSAEQAAWRSATKGSVGPINDLSFGKNVWWSFDGVKTNDFNCGSWEAWQAKGMDAGSVLADPLFRDWRRGDWRLRPESPALALGFREWDYAQAGVRRENPAWRKLAASVEPASYEVAPVPPRYEGRRSFATGFEVSKPGHTPTGSFRMPGSSREKGYIMCSTRARRTGRQSLELRDFKGLKPRYWPYFYQDFKIFTDTFVLKTSFKCDPRAYFVCEWRQWNGQSYFDGPYLFVKDRKFVIRTRKDGKAVDLPVDGYLPDTWFDLVFTVRPAKGGRAPSWDLSVTREDGQRFAFKDLPFKDERCRVPEWVGFLSEADDDTVTFLDDYSYESVP